MTKCTMYHISLTCWHFEIRSNKESWLHWDDNNKVKVVGLMPEMNQLVWYKEMVCILFQTMLEYWKWHRMKRKKGDSSALERPLRLKFYRFVSVSWIFESWCVRPCARPFYLSGECMFLDSLSCHNKGLEWRTLKPPRRVTALRSWIDRVIALRSQMDHVIALRQISVTAQCHSSILFRR